MKQWWSLGVEEVINKLQTDVSAGLSGKEAADRLKRFGYNRIEGKKGPSPLSIFLAQLRISLSGF
jgi:Ca2+-transporting ATPase